MYIHSTWEALAELGIDVGESAAQSAAVVDHKDELGQVQHSISSRILHLKRDLESQASLREGLSKSHMELEGRIATQLQVSAKLEAERDQLGEHFSPRQL